MDGPRSLARLAARLRALFRGRALDSELDEELRFHVEHLIADGVARGLTPEAARREALLAMGGIEQRKEECRDTRGVRLIEDFLQDVRYAARTLRRSPAFTFTAIATLTLGIGTTVAMFSVVNGVLLRPLPFPQPDRLFLVALSPKSFFMAQPGMADVTYLQFRERDRTFQHLAAFSSYKGNLTGAGDPVVVKMASVTTEFFDAVGVGPAMGRTFLSSDGEPGREQTIVISDQLWRSRFGSDPQIVGRIIRLNDISHTVVGVMPAGFDFPGAKGGVDADGDQDHSGQFAARAGRRPAETGRHRRAGACRIRNDLRLLARRVDRRSIEMGRRPAPAQGAARRRRAAPAAAVHRRGAGRAAHRLRERREPPAGARLRA